MHTDTLSDYFKRGFVEGIKTSSFTKLGSSEDLEPDAFENLTKGVLGSMVGSLGAGAAGLVGVKGADLLSSAPLSESRINEIIRDYNRNRPSSARVTAQLVPRAGMEAAFDPVQRRVIAPVGDTYGVNPILRNRAISEEVLRHELGHADNYAPFRTTRGRQRALIARQGTSALGGLAGLALLSSGNEDLVDKAWMANLAGNVPTLVDEGSASVRATREMVRRHGFAQGLRRSASLIPAFGTYTTPILGTYLGGRFINRFLADRGEEAEESPRKKPAKKEAA